MILLLLGEKAGMRADVPSNPPDPARRAPLSFSEFGFEKCRALRALKKEKRGKE